MTEATILFLAANPLSSARLALDEEARDIEERIQVRSCRIRLTLRSRWAVRPDDLLLAFNQDRPTVVHFSGHGAGAGGLVFHDAAGQERTINGDTLQNLFSTMKDNIRIVVLNSCYSEHQAKLICEAIDCVIGMNGTIGDHAARTFSAAFYRALGHGQHVGNAFRQGLVALELAGLKESGVPRLLVRDGVAPSEIFLAHNGTAAAAASPMGIAEGARSPDPHPESQHRCVVVIKASLRDMTPAALARLTEELCKYASDMTLKIEKIEEGSVRITVVASKAGKERLLSLAGKDELREVGGFEVLAVEATALAEKVRVLQGSGKVIVSRRSLAVAGRAIAGLYHLETPRGAIWDYPEGDNVLVGRRLLDHYALDARIGAGGSSVVYAGRQLSTGQKVAIKVLRTSDLGTRGADTEAARRFSRELALTAGLSHPHIVRLIDAGTLDTDVIFTVLEYIEGVSLAEVLKAEGPLSPHEARRFMLQTLDALSAAHAAGVVHRDVKPTNLMVSGHGAQRNIRLLEFGTSALIHSPRGREALAYVAPEQIRGFAPVPQSDIYAWGLVFVECLTGRRVMTGRSIDDVLRLQLEPDPVPLPPGVEHHPLRRILERATAKDIEARYASALEAFHDLERCDLGALTVEGTDVPPGHSRRGTLDARHAAPMKDSSPERRQVTALFVSFDPLRPASAEVDPQDLAELLRDARLTVEAILRGRRTTRGAARPDEIVAYFGYPSAAEDAARRAVSTALSIARAVPQARVGVHTGLAVVDVSASNPDLVDETTAIAAHAAASCDEGSVWVTAATRALVEMSFALEPTAISVDRHGEPPMPLYRVAGEAG